VVEVDEDPNVITLSIRDDGSGFETNAASDGFGLLGMRERVELLDGELTIESEPGKGTLVRARLPVQRRAQERAATAAATI
jgi:two-component system, NarL family, sensor histidine kinase DegS